MNNSKVVGIVATVLVVALVVAGLFAVGSPSTARDLRADEQRRQYLNELHYQLSEYVSAEGALPASLEELDYGYSGSYDPRRDPQTGEFFEYSVLSDTSYELCAEFQTSSEQARDRFFGEVVHEEGRNCFERDTTEELRDPRFPEVPVKAPLQESDDFAEPSPTPEAAGD